MTHFIGIGGIGMSAIARLLLLKKQRVSGSDLKDSKRLSELVGLGATINVGHSLKDFSDVSTVVYSTVIEDNNKELVLAKKQNIPVIHRSDLLKTLMKPYRSLCVTGAHGKTSTSSLLAWTLYIAKADPSYVIGGILKSFNQNSHLGQGDFFVAEADESDGSFLNVEYEGAIITNADFDHVNYWKDPNKLEEAYVNFMSLAPTKKLLFMCGDDPILAKHSKFGTLYGFSDCEWKISDFKQEKLTSEFTITHHEKVYPKIRLNLPGKHYALNATAVFAMAISLGISENLVREALQSFPGVKRRLDVLYSDEKVTVIDDYAHHPKEILTLYRALKNAFQEQRLVAIFEPHRISRLQLMEKEFIRALSAFDVAITTEVFLVGEKPPCEAFFSAFCKQIDKFIPKNSLIEEMGDLIRPGDVLVFIGAGEISAYADLFTQHLKEVR